MSDVFISYVEEDSEIAVAIAQELEEAGYATWYYSRDTLPSVDHLEQSTDQIQQAQAVLVLVSRNTLRSPQVHTEIVRAQREGKRFVPILHGITFEELEKRRSVWTTSFAASPAVEITAEGIPAIVSRIVAGLRAAGVRPSAAMGRASPLEEMGSGTRRLQPPRPDSSQIFARSDSTEFAAHAESLLTRARRIIFVGTGLNLLQHDPIFVGLAERAQRGECDVEIYMADPFCPDVEMRLLEEELGTVKPSVGRGGLVQRLTSMLQKAEEMGWPPNFSLKLFCHYPTFAMGILDDDYFVYPYGYALLGNFSPVQHFSRSRPADMPMIEFLEGQYRRVKATAVDARLVFDLRRGERVAIDRLMPFAAYLVPEAGSALYEFGSKVLGYYVRERHSAESQWAEHVGGAAEFGFHLTLADALYFPTRAEVGRAYKEVELLARDIQSFRLTDLKVEAGVPNACSIALTCRDDSGTLEALHHEMVFRVYRRACGSNYTLDRRPVDRDSDHSRAQLMIRRYRAPYILGRFMPHFTLLGNVAPSQIASTAGELEALFKYAVADPHLDVRSVALMSRPSPARPWEIAREIRLT